MDSIGKSSNTEKSLIYIIIAYLFRKPISILKSFSSHPLSILSLFLLLFPIYLIAQYTLSFLKYLFYWPKNSSHILELQKQQQELDEDDEFLKYLESCSICFESKLDFCLDYCRDQFCLDCFQKYVTQVVHSSWGLSVTKIRCPVCKINIHPAEWTKFVPKSLADLYYQYNQPYRNFFKCCPQCETEVIPCEKYTGVYEIGQSQNIASMLRDLFYNPPLNKEIDADRQYMFIRAFDKLEWRNSTLPDIHHNLMDYLLCHQQVQNAKVISQKIMQLEMRPDTWKKLQFDYISFFSTATCPTCEISFCLQCGENSHENQTCEENMKRLIMQSKQQTDYIVNLEWKVQNSQRCPSCSIFIHRDEGCNKVDCSLCGHTFCWECTAPWFEGCSYFLCKKNKEVRQVIEEILTTAEAGVPDMDMIHSRLNSNSTVSTTTSTI